MSKLTHTDDRGKANMVDVGGKTEQLRIAEATGKIMLQPETLRLVRENSLKKGDVLTVAEIAGIQAAKKTAEMIPLCHPLPLTKIEVKLSPEEDAVRATSLVHCISRTGVEMEALTAVSVALLTVYDMCKAVDKTMTILDIKLISKTKTDL